MRYTYGKEGSDSFFRWAETDQIKKICLRYSMCVTPAKGSNSLYLSYLILKSKCFCDDMAKNHSLPNLIS